MDRTKFWMVLGNGVPTHRHQSRQSAETEAARLARANPGVAFTVLESLSTVMKTDVSWDTHVDRSNDSPF